MPGNIGEKIYHHFVSYSGYMIEIISDDIFLLRVDFVREEKIKNSTPIPDPIIKVLSFFNDYFNGRKSEIKICFYKYGDVISKNDSGNLYLNMSDYTEKEISVYKNLLNVKSGKTISYSELAELSGFAKGSRFAGNCMARNNFPVIIPCHRVVKKDGSIGNYTGGVEIKKYLLNHEGNSLSSHS